MSSKSEFGLVQMRLSLTNYVYDKIYADAKKMGLSPSLIIRVILTAYTENGITIALKAPEKNVIE